jgi:hypothetical protein
MQYYRSRYVGGPKLDTPTTAQRADMLKARLAELRGETVDRKYDDIHNPYDFDDSERY